jgi:hypothetical protein
MSHVTWGDPGGNKGQNVTGDETFSLFDDNRNDIRY